MILRVALFLAAALASTAGLALDVDIRAFGAKCDNATDDVLAIRKAIAAVAAAGGGTVFFPPGTCLLTTSSTYTVKVAIAAANFTTNTESHTYHFLMHDVDNVRWQGNGTILKSTINGSEMIIADGVRNFSADNIELRTNYAHDGTGAVTTVGSTGWGFTSQTRDSYNIRLTNIKGNGLYVGVYVFGDPASSFRVRSLSIDNYRQDNGHYAIALHDNGNTVTATGVHASNVLRELFAFGVSDVDAQITSDTGVAGFGSIIKAYDRDTVGVRLKLKTSKVISGPLVAIQSQHAPAVQAIPKRVLASTVDIDSTETPTITPVDFAYYRDNTFTATSANNLFSGIVLRGVVGQPVTISSTQAGSFAARGSLNTDGLVLLAGSINSLYNNTGFDDSKQVYGTFAVALRINNLTAGITYGGLTSGEFWRDGRWVEMLVRIVLTNKGGNVGAVSLDLPFPSATYNVGNALIRGIGNANVAGMVGPITGYVTNGGTVLQLQIQGAAAAAALTDANLTNTSDLLLHVRYPI